MAALQPQYLCRAADIPVVLSQFLKNVITLVGGACLMQCRKFRSSVMTGAITVYQRREMLTIEAKRRRIHDDNAFDQVAQLTHVARPGISHQSLDRTIGNFTRPPTISCREFFQEMTGQHRDILLAFSQGRNKEGNYVQAVKQIFTKVSF